MLLSPASVRGYLLAVVACLLAWTEPACAQNKEVRDVKRVASTADLEATHRTFQEAAKRLEVTKRVCCGAAEELRAAAKLLEKYRAEYKQKRHQLEIMTRLHKLQDRQEQGDPVDPKELKTLQKIVDDLGR